MNIQVGEFLDGEGSSDDISDTDTDDTYVPDDLDDGEDDEDEEDEEEEDEEDDNLDDLIE
jgi:hypothetical protein